MTEALAEQHKGIPIVGSTQNLSQYMRYWLSSVKTSVRPKTYESYDLNVRRLEPLLGKQRVNALKPAAVERAYGQLIEKGLSRRTVVQTHTVLHSALKKALQWGMIGRNPCDSVSVPRPEQTEMKTLRAEEVR